MFQFDVETKLDFDVNRLALPEEQSGATRQLAPARGKSSGAGGGEGDDDGEWAGAGAFV